MVQMQEVLDLAQRRNTRDWCVGMTEAARQARRWMRLTVDEIELEMESINTARREQMIRGRPACARGDAIEAKTQNPEPIKPPCVLESTRAESMQE